MKNITIFLIAAFLSVCSASAQSYENNGFRRTDYRDNDSRKNGLVVSLGAAVNYYYGPGDRNIEEFENDRLNWQANGMLGLTITRDRNDRRTMIAGFGSFGINNDETVKNIFNDQSYISLATDQSSSNSVYQLEGGLLIAEVFRISTGVGQQVFNKQILISNDGIETEATSLKYNSTTVGFNFNVSAVAININCSFNYGQDYNKTVIVPSAGLMLRF